MKKTRSAKRASEAWLAMACIPGPEAHGIPARRAWENAFPAAA
jgi:hypothetical protein